MKAAGKKKAVALQSITVAESAAAVVTLLGSTIRGVPTHRKQKHIQGNEIEETIDEGEAMDVDRDPPDALDMLGEVEGSQQQIL